MAALIGNVISCLQLVVLIVSTQRAKGVERCGGFVGDDVNVKGQDFELRAYANTSVRLNFLLAVHGSLAEGATAPALPIQVANVVAFTSIFAFARTTEPGLFLSHISKQKRHQSTEKVMTLVMNIQ